MWGSLCESACKIDFEKQRMVYEDNLSQNVGLALNLLVMSSRDGRTRQFGFVGFRTAEEAQEAVKYFHRTFFDTSRLTCEVNPVLRCTFELINASI